jgi:hypothetical protein
VKEWEAPGMTRGYPGGGSRGVAGGPGTLLADGPATFHGVLSDKGNARDRTKRSGTGRPGRLGA